MAKSKSTSIVSQEASEAVKERLKRLNDLETKNRTASIDQTSSDEDNDKVIDVASIMLIFRADWHIVDVMECILVIFSSIASAYMMNG